MNLNISNNMITVEVKKIKFCLLLVLAVLNCCHTIKAEKITYSLEVVDSITRMYVSYPDVLAFEPGDSVNVGEVTYFSIGAIKKEQTQISLPANDKDYNIVIDAEGYYRLRRTVRLTVR